MISIRIRISMINKIRMITRTSISISVSVSVSISNEAVLVLAMRQDDSVHTASALPTYHHAIMNGDSWSTSTGPGIP